MLMVLFNRIRAKLMRLLQSLFRKIAERRRWRQQRMRWASFPIIIKTVSTVIAFFLIQQDFIRFRGLFIMAAVLPVGMRIGVLLVLDSFGLFVWWKQAWLCRGFYYFTDVIRFCVWRRLFLIVGNVLFAFTEIPGGCWSLFKKLGLVLVIYFGIAFVSLNAFAFV